MHHHADENYRPCHQCGRLADDGGLREEQFICFDCLEK